MRLWLWAGFNLSLVQSADLCASDNARSKKFNNFLFTLPDFARTDLTLSVTTDPDRTCLFASRHNTIRYLLKDFLSVRHKNKQ